MAFGQLVRGADVRLREWLETSKIESGTRLPSERSLARTLEMQHYAVNRAMARLIADGVVERRGYKLFYSPMQKNRPRDSMACDLIISHRSIFLAGYQKVARELGVNLRLHRWESSEEAVSILKHLKATECESVIFDPPFGEPISLWEPGTSRLVKHGVPVVCINHSAPGVSSVQSDGTRSLELLFDHFLDLGHEEMAFLTLSPWTPSSSEIFMQWRWLCAKNELPNSTERIHLQNDSRFLPEDARRLAKRFGKEWSKVTALAVFMDDEYPVQHMLDALADNGVDVPERLSLAFVGDCRALQSSTPTVTAATTDAGVLQETAYHLAARGARKKREFGILPQPCVVHIQPQLVRRGSTAPHQGPRRIKKQEAPQPETQIYPQPMQFPDKTEDLEAIQMRPYDLTAKISESRFTQVDLSSHVNRPLNFRRGWLGDLPLKHFNPGRHQLHGVPFDVLGGSSRSDCGAVVFQSLINTTGSAKKLPSTLRIEIDQKVSAIYFLHGCGYAKHRHPFASYSFFAGKKRLAEVPLVALGKSPPDITPETLSEAISRANIQDWWPDYPHYEFPHARVVPLLENENPEAVHRHVFLYTLEWINPNPKSTVSHLVIRSDIEQSTTLGLLAISVLKTS
jgi:DNA-binding LacI/PurR family transcriptional regulator